MAETPQRNIRLLVEYDGTAYLGWQSQRDGPTIQAALGAAIERLTGEKASLRVAGRTDAGVHALGQVANFRTRARIPAERFAPACTSLLPRDITVHRSDEVPLDFDARRSARSKRYRYRLYHGAQPAALERDRAWHIRGTLDLQAMREAALLLVGERDFAAFRSVHCDAPHARRYMFDIRIEALARPPAGEYVDIVFHANAFCRHMCRILAGTLVEVARGKRSVENVAHVLASGDRTLAGVTAPAAGLTLLEVLYP